MTTYTVGELHNPQPEELERPYGDLEAAREAAREWSTRDQFTAIAVWDDHCDVVCIVIQGVSYKPE